MLWQNEGKRLIMPLDSAVESSSSGEATVGWLKQCIADKIARYPHQRQQSYTGTELKLFCGDVDLSGGDKDHMDLSYYIVDQEPWFVLTPFEFCFHDLDTQSKVCSLFFS